MSGILHLEKSWIFLIKIGLFKFVISIGRRTNVEIGWRFKTRSMVLLECIFLQLILIGAWDILYEDIGHLSSFLFFYFFCFVLWSYNFIFHIIYGFFILLFVKGFYIFMHGFGIQILFYSLNENIFYLKK